MDRYVYCGIVNDNNHDDSILYTFLLLRTKECKFGFIGGKVQDEDLEETVWREIKDELGLTDLNLLEVKENSTLELLSTDIFENTEVSFYKCNVNNVIFRSLYAMVGISDALFKNHSGSIVLSKDQVENYKDNLWNIFMPQVDRQLLALFNIDTENAKSEEDAQS